MSRTYSIILIGVLLTGLCAYGWYMRDRIVPHTFVGAISVGGLTRDQAAAQVQAAIDAVSHNGIPVAIGTTTEVIQPGAIAFDVDIAETVNQAFARGHTQNFFVNIWQQTLATVIPQRIDAPVHFDESLLRSQLSDISDLIDMPRKDVRLQMSGTHVTLLTDTQPGSVVDQAQAFTATANVLRALSTDPVVLQQYNDVPQADPATAQGAVIEAQKMMARSLTLQYEDAQFYISREKIGSWITSTYDARQLHAGLDRDAISAYVTTIAHALNVAPQSPQITTEGERITGFVPAKVGRAVQEDVLAQMISDTLTARISSGIAADVLTVPLRTTKLALTGLNSTVGITELIGKATTPFTGSPKNRISNIKNGMQFLSGSIVQPGAEFSTLATLGTVDNTTGYLPELVIKGDRTVPEFGGGLCQVSTTLFRAVLNAGLPVTARRNHSYRVSYYEKDGNGTVIGPGLDATIYQPDVDFKFFNDMKTPVLIIGYAIGDKATFELYGTKDGRTSTVIGPKLLSEIPAGDPIYIETTDLPVGAKKQVETPHPGGSATATYTITYADGHVDTKTFTSYYRRWPAQYLVGVAALSSPSPSPSPVAVQ